MKRLVIHTKDIVIITGKSERYARELIRKMKEHYLKKSHQYITIKECCQYLGLDQDEVEEEII